MKTMHSVIRALSLTMGGRDPFTADHQLRVANLAQAIAQEMGLLEDQVEGIYLAGSIHDIGTVSIPIEILCKPGRLTEMEFRLIKGHPNAGFEILKDIEFPWPIAQIILQHHERLDGSGYPTGISGDEILLEAKILAVADVVEAISSHRPHRPAHGVEVALQGISQNKGNLFDPTPVEACLKLFKEKGYQLH